MTYDARREVVVLVGAVSGGGTGTWEFDGVDWQLTAATRNEIGLSGHKLVYDAARGAVVSFGGEKVSGMFIVSTNETWEYAILAEFAPFGSSCAASGRIPKLAVQPYSAPRSGKTMFAEVSNLSAGAQPIMVVGFDNQTWNGVSLPLGLNALGLPACQLLISADAGVLLGQPGGHGAVVTGHSGQPAAARIHLLRSSPGRRPHATAAVGDQRCRPHHRPVEPADAPRPGCSRSWREGESRESAPPTRWPAGAAS